MTRSMHGPRLTITRRYEFSSAHHLNGLGKDHKCSRQHGHNYVVEVTVWASGGLAHGMIIDAANLDTIIRPILARVDHRYINELDLGGPASAVRMQNQPTVENIALWLWDALELLSNGGVMRLVRLILRQGARGFEKMRAAEELDWRVRQATGIAKAPYAADFVRMLVEGGEQVVLYGWHRAVYDIWLSRLRDLRPVLYTGSETPKQKDEALQAFIRGDARVLIMSLRSGAGVDGLQKVCRTVVFGELDWSPGVHEQCSGRVFRDGQAHPVVSYYLLAREGSDPVIADTLGVKEQQLGGLLRPDAPLIEKLTVDPDHMKKLAERFLAQRGAATDSHAPADLEVA